ncbi:MAG TPA: hypothetical protein VH165_20970 [Kofleriaceae bacterium]|jgi:hypothetical protein|nr:hypothetical protein [Kofleriaceae bacterium]
MGRALGLVALVAIAAPVAWLGRARVAHAAPDTLASLLERTDAVAHEVARIRGLPLKHPIPNDVVDRDQLRARLIKSAAEDKTAAETAAEGFALERWGLVPPGTDYPVLLIDLMTEQLAGYYDSDTKQLTISKSAGDDPTWAEMVLAHELDHGLQDQAFDLHHFEDVPDSEGDAAIARRALVEGDGVALMIEVLVDRRHAKIDWASPAITAAIAKGMTLGTGTGTGPDADHLDRAPLAIREAMLFPYRAGLSFVAALRRHQSWSAVDAAFARPPKSTEQILHPDRYVADDPPVPVALDVPAALPGYTIAHSTVWGELGFDLWLRSHGVDDAIAAVAAAGWGGDRAIVLARPGDHRAAQAVGIAHTEWDTEADAIEAAEAAGKALADTVVGATLERTATRTRLFGLDGTVSWLERRGATLILVVGAPSWSADALAAELWTPPPPPARKPAKPRPAKSPPRAVNLRLTVGSR